MQDCVRTGAKVHVVDYSFRCCTNVHGGRLLVQYASSDYNSMTVRNVTMTCKYGMAEIDCMHTYDVSLGIVKASFDRNTCARRYR